MLMLQTANGGAALGMVCAVAVDDVTSSRPVDPDAALAELAAKGDRQAFRKLVGLYQRRVFAVAFRMLGDSAEAEDVTQDVFVSLHGALAGFRRESRLSTWIYRITKNHCLN